MRDFDRIGRGWGTRFALSLGVLTCIGPRAEVAAQPVGEGSGPLSEISRPLKDDSAPVHERGHSVSDGSAGSMKSGPVRGNRRVGMLSGPVSEVSRGPTTSGRSMTGGGSVAENSSGAVKQGIDHSLGEQVYDLQRALGPLQNQVRQQAEADAAAALEDAAAEAAAEAEPDGEVIAPESQLPAGVDTGAAADGNVANPEPEAPIDMSGQPQPTPENEAVQ